MEIFGDIAEGFKALVQGIEKIVSSRSKYLDKKQADLAASVLRQLSKFAVRERLTLGVSFIPSLEGFSRQPSVENWIAVKTEIAVAFGLLEGLAAELEAHSDLIATENFFAPFMESVLHRGVILSKLMQMPYPEGIAEQKKVRAFLETYNKMLLQMDRVIWELNKYTREISGPN